MHIQQWVLPLASTQISLDSLNIFTTMTWMETRLIFPLLQVFIYFIKSFFLSSNPTGEFSGGKEAAAGGWSLLPNLNTQTWYQFTSKWRPLPHRDFNDLFLSLKILCSNYDRVCRRPAFLNEDSSNSLSSEAWYRTGHSANMRTACGPFPDLWPWMHLRCHSWPTAWIHLFIAALKMSRYTEKIWHEERAILAINGAKNGALKNQICEAHLWGRVGGWGESGVRGGYLTSAHKWEL